jgi:site-specific DNA recombinase
MISSKKAKTAELEAKRAVGIWIRVSTEHQAEGESPEVHEHRARAFATAKGWEVREVYHLEAVSGKAVMGHAEAKRMLADVRRGHISALIFSKLARLARNTKELLEFADIFRQEGADLVSLQESIDTSTPAGRLFYSMIAAMAQWEREEIADRINASFSARAKMGKPIAAKMPFGYKVENDKIVIVPSEAPIRKLMFELFAQHKRIKHIIRIMNEAGHRTREGNLWTDTSVGRLLRDPSAKGQYRANFTIGRKKGKPSLNKPVEQWTIIPVEPIVSEELWDQCNRILEANPKKVNRGKMPVQLFAGKVRCHCGRKMYVETRTSKYVCVDCLNKIPVVDLEAVYIEQLKGFFVSPEAIARHLEMADTHVLEKERVLSVLHDELTKVDVEIKRIYRLHMDEKLDGDSFVEFYNPLKARKAQLNEEIPRLQAEVDLIKINAMSADEIYREADTLYSRWPALEHADKIRIIDSLVDGIAIGTDEIDITLCYVDSSEEVTKGQRALRGRG